MFGIRKIVVGVKMPHTQPWLASTLGSPVRSAIQNARLIAEATRIPVMLVTVLESDQIHLKERYEADLVLHELTREFAGSDFETCVRTGVSWEELIRVAGEGAEGLIVCGIQDGNNPEQSLFGYTASNLLRHSPGPVWIVKHCADDRDTTDIVAATDATSVSLDVLKLAVPFARFLNGRLHIVTCIGPRSEPLSGPQSDVMIEQTRDAVYHQLVQTDYRTLPFGVRVTVPLKSLAEGVLDVVRDSPTDLLILEVTSSDGDFVLFQDGKAEAWISERLCSVLAVKPEGYVSELPADFWGNTSA